jgi:lysophospholipase L1-like esterase
MNMTKRSLLSTLAIITALGLLFGSGIGVLAQQRPGSATWITAWGTSQAGLAPEAVKITNATVRMMARVTIPGDSVRVRLDNTFGTSPLVIGKASVGHRMRSAGAQLVAGSNKPVLFKGSATVTIPAGGSVVSDTVALKVLAWQDLAVSLHIPESNVRPSQHGGAVKTSFMTADGAGDLTADESGTPFTPPTPGATPAAGTPPPTGRAITSTYWLKSIDVLSSTSTGAIVAFGDSITDGSCTTLDAHDRWEDVLLQRLYLEAEGRGTPGVHKAVVNEAIGGNTVTKENLTDLGSPAGIDRLDRDVLSHSGVTHVVVFEGTNDIRRDAPAAQVIAGLQNIVTRVKARGLKVIGVTIIPRHNTMPTPGNTGWTTAKTQTKNEVNQWIQSRAGFDGVLDFDAVTRDPANPALINAAFNCDGTHPNPRGYFEMGKSVRLDLFKEGLAATTPSSR